MPPQVGSRNSMTVGKLYVGAGGIVNSGSMTSTPTQSIASAASATLNALGLAATTFTLTGSTNITTATGFNVVNYAQPTITSASAVTVTNAATVAIQNAPTTGGSTTITNPYALWVVAGGTRFGGAITLDSGINIVANATTGSKIATGATQKLGFWNATPVVQPATTGTSTLTAAGAGTALKNDSTSTGGSGATAYTFSDVVVNLKNAGLLAA